MSLVPADIVNAGDHLVWTFPGWLELRWLASGLGRRQYSQNWSPSWNPAELSHSFVGSLNPVTDYLQLLMGIMMDVM
jgi:hypothetical protein